MYELADVGLLAQSVVCAGVQWGPSLREPLMHVVERSKGLKKSGICYRSQTRTHNCPVVAPTTPEDGMGSLLVPIQTWVN